MRNFNETDYDDYDRLKQIREFHGRVTPKRLEIINSFVERFNEENRYPYGEGYSCGHIHDCCGCLSRNYMNIETNENKIQINWIQTFNY